MSENNVIPEQTHLVYVKTLEEIVDANNKKRKMKQIKTTSGDSKCVFRFSSRLI